MDERNLDVQDTCDVRDALIRNGFDFLQKAATELEHAPGESLIHLCSGLELLTKARLAHEHWSLVDERPGETELASVRKGAFASVGFHKAIDRIEKVTARKWSQDERRLLKKLAEHRNKIVHFYHEELENPDQELRSSVARDQCRAWNLLRELIEGPWQGAFPNSEGIIRRLQDAFKKNRAYLAFRFENAKGDLSAARKGGKIVGRCALCDFDAVISEEGNYQLVRSVCKVCEARNFYIRFDCPACRTPLHLEPEISESCPHCSGEFSISDLCDAIGLQSEPIASCWECGDWETDTVHASKDGTEALCLFCLADYGAKSEECGNCGRMWVGSDEDQIAFWCPDCRDRD